MTNDLSLSTAVISFVIALVGWGLKSTITGLIKYLKSNIEEMAKLKTELVSVEIKVQSVLELFNDVQKLKTDLNIYYSRLRQVEDDVRQLKNNA